MLRSMRGKRPVMITGTYLQCQLCRRLRQENLEFQNQAAGTGETAVGLKVLIVFAGELGSLPSTHMEADNLHSKRI